MRLISAHGGNPSHLGHRLERNGPAKENSKGFADNLGGVIQPKMQLNKYNPLPALGGEKKTLSNAPYRHRVGSNQMQEILGGAPPNNEYFDKKIDAVKINPIEKNRTTPNARTLSRQRPPPPTYEPAETIRKQPGKSLPKIVGGQKHEKPGPFSRMNKETRTTDETQNDTITLEPNEILAIDNKNTIKPHQANHSPAIPNTLPQQQPFTWRVASKSMPGYSDGKLKINQDVAHCITAYKGCQSCGIFAVFDGHGSLGHKVSEFLKNTLKGSLGTKSRNS